MDTCEDMDETNILVKESKRVLVLRGNVPLIRSAVRSVDERIGAPKNSCCV